ncbi:hypothetical protein SRHO_G00233230 [Serrasalmus rhombeus]
MMTDRSLPEPPNFKEGSVPQERDTQKRSDSPVSSCVSLKSDRSLPEPPNLTEGSISQERTEERSTSPVSSSVSMMTDRSLPEPPNFKEGSVPQERDTQKRSDSPVSSCVSLKSDRSLPEPPNLTEGSVSQERTEERSTSPVSSSVSVTTNRSLPDPPNFKEGSVPQERDTQKRSDSPVSSCVSLKSDRSLPEPPNLTEGSVSQERTEERSTSPVSSSVSMTTNRSLPDPPNFKEGSVPQERDTQKRSDSPVSSCVSLKSDRSLPEPPNLTEGSVSQERTEERSTSPVSSSVSMTTNRSLPDPPNFKEGSVPQERDTQKRSDFPVSSCVSLKSDRSLPEPPNLTEGSVSQERTKDRSTSPVSSSVSMMTDRSLPEPPNFKVGSVPQERTEERSTSPVSSSVSVTTNRSRAEPPNFQEGSVPQERETQKRSDSPVSSSVSLKNNQSLPEPPNLTEGSISQERYQSGSKSRGKLQKKIDALFNIFDALERKIIGFVKHELEMYKKILRRQNTTYYRKVEQCKWGLRHEVLNMTMSFLRDMEHEDLADALQNELIGIIQRPLKKRMREKCLHVYEGIAKQGESTSLNTIYTELYITEGGARQVNKEHEVRLIEKNNGVAGIGKSICVQKFILDWAEGKEYQDIQFIFPLPFRELNLKKKERHSLMDIIYLFFPETKGLRLSDQNKVLFIFDGLDECQLPLAFQKNEFLNNVSTSAPLDAVMTNLIKGNLLPFALIWITTRPAATSMIPAECIDRVTEVRGFNDEQKEEYFRKRISDQHLANKIIDHIKESRSLHIMCHIPVFCWISATVLQRILEETESEETPKTLTQMYTCFLIYQTIQGNVKYTGKNALDIPWDKEGMHSLGKLAFQHLEENSLIFYREDLDTCGIDPSKISVYSGLCTQETGRFQDTVYSFVHLSIQEFLAALFAYISLRNNQKNVLDHQSESQESKITEVIDFLKTAVDKALKSDHGHLDLFLRFLLGLSLESNEKLIRGLLTQKGSRSDCQKDIVEYIKLKFKENPSPERSINLFYCLNELNDDSLVKEIQSHMNSGRLSEAELSPAQWSALVFVLLTSKEKLEVFDLKKFIRSDECLIRLQSVLKEATSALLSECNLTERSCSALSKVLSSESSKLTLLGLSGNPIQDRGLELLSAGLESADCKLETLRLSFCSITEEGYAALASALKSKPSSHLIELDLSGNDPGDTGVKKLINLLDDPNSNLKKLRLLKSSTAEEVCDSLTKALGINPLLLRELDLSGKLQGDSEMKKISDLLEDSHCRPNKLLLNKCSITEEGCAALSSALCSNPSHMTELDLSENQLGDSGVKKICEILKNPQSVLQKLQLSFCSITEEGYAALASALKSKPSSHLIELDLSGNNPGDTGVKTLINLLDDPNSNLKKLRLSFCSITEEGYAALASALKSNPSSQLIELDLSGNDPGDTGVKTLINLLDDPNSNLKKLRLLSSSAAEEVCDSLTKVLGINPLLLSDLDLSGKIQADSEMKKVSDLLEDSHCRTQKLTLNKNSITEEGCAALSSALCSNPSHLIELDLSENKLGDSGVKKICSLLGNQGCKLMKVGLSFCSITEEGYAALASALTSNCSSHLMELDLRGNDPGDTGVQKLINLLDDPNSNLKKLRFLKAPAAEEICDSLTKVVGTNPLLLRELDLSGKIQGVSELQQLCSLLEDAHCKIERLGLSNCSITLESCAVLASILSLDSSSVRKMDLSNNNLLDPGMKDLTGGLTNANCKLEIIMLKTCALTKESCSALADVLNSKYSHLNELDLSNNNLEDSGVVQLSVGLKNPHSSLKIIRLSNSSITEDGCGALASALKSNPSHLMDLDLSENIVENSGVKLLCDLLMNSNCMLQKLRLSFCSITEDGYVDLASALKSNPSSHLIELDLRGNDPGDTGVKKLTDLVDDPNCKLKTLRLLKSFAAEEACGFLTTALGTNPLLMRELDLSGKTQGDSGMKKISDLLEDSHCKTRKLKLNKCSITEEGCAALASALCSNPSHLIELDLSENQLGTSGVKKICGVLGNTLFKLSKLELGNCSITDEGCAALASAFRTNPLHLRELNLSGNNVGNFGVKHLSELLVHSQSTLEKLHLSFCSITEEGYAALASSLKSNPSSHLIELDLRGNNPGDTGVKKLMDLLYDPNCKLKTLRLLKSSIEEEVCDSLTKVLGISPLLLRELDLSGKIQGNTEMKKISVLLEDSHCRPKTLKMNKSSITEEGCAALSSALCSNPSHLIELDLSDNQLGTSGVKKICSLLKESNCKLSKLNLSFCNVTEGGYTALSSALKSNSSHLVELDLRGNDPGDRGVKMLTDLVDDPNSKLKTLRLLKSSTAEEFCDSLTKALGKNPLLLRELDLSGKIQGDSGMKKLSDLLEDSHCRITKLLLTRGSITEEGCAALASALCSNPSHLIELDLSENQLGDSGVKKICSLLNNLHCKLKKLNLSFCSLTEEGYVALASALKSSPSSPLTELDLRGNNPGDTGVKKLTDIFGDSRKTLRLLKSSDAEKACKVLNKRLGQNPLLQRELDLSRTELKDIKVKQLCALLEDPHYRLEKLTLYKSGSITERDCAALVSALIVNPSHLRELDLNKNKLDKSGVQKLCNLLNNPHCKLKKLTLNKNNVTSKDCADLASALSSSLSHLRELDLSENEIQDSGLKHFCDVLKTQECKLEKLLLMSCGIKEKGCAALVAALKLNSSHLKVLDLRENSLGNSVNDLAEVLKDSGCNIQLDGALKKFIKEVELGFRASLSWFFGGKNKAEDGTDGPQSGVDEERLASASSGVYGERLASASSGLYGERSAPASGGADMSKEARTTCSLAEQPSAKGGNYGTGVQGTKFSNRSHKRSNQISSKNIQDK